MGVCILNTPSCNLGNPLLTVTVVFCYMTSYQNKKMANFLQLKV